MTIQQIIDQFGNNASFILNYYIILLLFSLLGLLLVRPSTVHNFVLYLYTVLVYAICIPALLSFILLLYSFFFLRTNLLQLNALTYFLPIVALIVIFFIVKKTIPLKDIPGFEKISGLFLLIIVTFIVTYVLQKMFFGIFFIGSFTHLIVAFLVLLGIFRYGWYKIMR